MRQIPSRWLVLGLLVCQPFTHACGTDVVDATHSDVASTEDERLDALEAVPDLVFNRYHTQAEIRAYMRATARALPDLAKFEVLGQSLERREIGLLTLHTAGNPPGPGVFLNGTHHGDEKAGTEATLGMIDYLVTHRDEPEIAQLLKDYTIYIVPLVNPDGHARNTRADAMNRDPNRDYSYPERSDARSFALPEIRLIKALQDRVRFKAAIAYHSGSTAVFWPWCYGPNRHADYNLFHTLSKRAALAMNIQTYTQSYFDYPSRGEYIDYAYWKHQTLGITIEVYNVKTPAAASLSSLVDRSIAGSMAYIQGVVDHDRRQLRVEAEDFVHYGASGRTPVQNGDRLE